MAGSAMKVLVPVDGSENSLRAVRHVIKLVRDREPPDIHLVNVQPPVSGDVTTFVGSSAVKNWHREEGEKALAAAKAELDRAGVPYHVHILVGSPGEVVAEFSKELGVDKIIMGTRGLGKAAGLILGSVANDVIRHADVPVTLVK